MSDIEKIIELILGKRGSGKSYLAKKMVLQHSRYLIYDTLGEYTDGVVIQSLAELSTFWEKVYRKKFRIIYQPLDPELEFDAICELVWQCENMTFLVEEVDRYARPLAMSLPFKEIIQRGRHHDITFIGVTQRPHGVDKLITSQAKAMYIFNTTEPRDIKYFQEVVGDGVIEKFAELKQYEYVKWQDGTDQLEIGRA
ncbi:MAG TPA: hypothetical protein VMY06_02625 [Sedimentisphaerales bacterium]|nr:hypothetical protein [Sedimentisphaerales bacterium]